MRAAVVLPAVYIDNIGITSVNNSELFEDRPCQEVRSIDAVVKCAIRILRSMFEPIQLTNIMMLLKDVAITLSLLS